MRSGSTHQLLPADAANTCLVQTCIHGLDGAGSAVHGREADVGTPVIDHVDLVAEPGGMQGGVADTEVTGQAEDEKVLGMLGTQDCIQSRMTHQVIEEAGIRVDQSVRALGEAEQELEVGKIRVELAFLGSGAVAVPQHHLLEGVTHEEIAQFVLGEDGMLCEFYLSGVHFADVQGSLPSADVRVPQVGGAHRVLFTNLDALFRTEHVGAFEDEWNETLGTRNRESAS